MEHVQALLQHGWVITITKSKQYLPTESISRVDLSANTATKTIFHRQLPPLAIAIQAGRIDIWKILREHAALTEEAKIEQLFYMISETEEGRPFPLEEFKELLGSVPAEKVDR